MGQGMHIGTLIYCFPVQGDRCKSRDNGVGVGAETTAGEGGWIFSTVLPLQAQSHDSDWRGRPN